MHRLMADATRCRSYNLPHCQHVYLTNEERRQIVGEGHKPDVDDAKAVNVRI